MKVYRNRNSSKIKTLIAMERSKCGLAAEQIKLRPSIVGILVLMAVVCVSATGTDVNSFIDDLLMLLFELLLLPRTQKREKKFKQKNHFLEVIVETCEFSCCYEFVFVSFKKRFYALNSRRRDVWTVFFSLE